MAFQEINVGAAANDSTGDPLRSAFGKVNENFTRTFGGAFKATNISSSAQSVGPSTPTKITATTLNSEALDVEGWYDLANARYTPLIPGWYFLGATIDVEPGDDQTRYFLTIGKNGSIAGEIINCGGGNGTGGALTPMRLSGAGMLYLNGTTDYVELWFLHGSVASKNLNTTDYWQSFFGWLAYPTG